MVFFGGFGEDALVGFVDVSSCQRLIHLDQEDDPNGPRDVGFFNQWLYMGYI